LTTGARDNCRTPSLGSNDDPGFHSGFTFDAIPLPIPHGVLEFGSGGSIAASAKGEFCESAAV
jgi:hypothetical protein